jgi:uncharacterized protein YdeI (YjbR/CyaY-like superfamily)
MEIYFEDRESWRGWLEQNHDTVDVLWLVFFKKHTGRKTVSYGAAVEEALCFGWIDSLVKRLDDDRYARKFTPRTNPRKWSPSNLKRFNRLVAAGKMTDSGLAVFDPDSELEAPRPSATDVPPPFFVDALAENPTAKSFFDRLAPSYRRQYVGWVCSAKREETRLRRMAEAISLMSRGQKLGMK